MLSRSMPSALRAALAVSLVSLLSLGSCDLAGSEGGPGSSPGIIGSVPPGPLPTPFTLENLRANPGIASLQSNSYSQKPSISETGRYIAFISAATNLVNGVNNGRAHVYVRDVQTQITSVVSVNDAGTQADNDSQDPFISDDGRYVVFTTVSALDSIAADVNGAWDVYRRDRVGADGFFEEDPNDTGDATTIRVSLVHGTNAAANSSSFRPSISNSGLRVAFQSEATNLSPFADSNGFNTDIYVREINTNTTFRLSCANGTTTGGNSTSFNPTISANGGHVSFMSAASNLVAGDTLGYYDVFRATVAHAPAVDRVSVGSGGTQPDNYCYTNYFHGNGRGISADGGKVAFASAAGNLVSGDFNGSYDVFVRSFVGGTFMTRILGESGQEPNSFTFDGRLSADGNRVAFMSQASNMGPDGNFSQDIFVKDLATGAVVLASNSPSGFSSEAPVVSADGKVAAFFSNAVDLVDNDTNSQQDVFIHAFEDGEFSAGTTLRVSVPTVASEADGPSFSATIASSGPVVVFASTATNLVLADTNGNVDIFVSDPIGQTVRIVSSNSQGTQGNGDSHNPVCSADGRFVAFESYADNFVDSDGDGSFDNDTNGSLDIFVHDVVSDVTSRVSIASDGSEADSDCSSPSISADGRFIAFQSIATTLDPAADGSFYQIFVHDRLTKTTTCVSVPDGATGTVGNSSSFNPAISANGQVVAFQSLATNLDPVATAGFMQVFVRNHAANATSCVSVANGTEANADSFDPSVSADGMLVAFSSFGSNLDPVATSGNSQVYVRNRQGAGSTACVSVAGGIEADSGSLTPFISSDGRYVSFDSAATNLHPASSSGVLQVFVRDRIANAIACVSINDLGDSGDFASFGASISTEGRWVAFISGATNLVTPDNGSNDDVFIRGPIDADSFILD